MTELLTEFRGVYVHPAEGVDDPDPRLVALDELLNRLLAVAAAAQQMHIELEAQPECPHCKAHAIGGATAHTDDCVAELLCSTLADLAVFEGSTDGAGSSTVLDHREGELSAGDLIAITPAGRATLARPCALELDEVAGG